MTAADKLRELAEDLVDLADLLDSANPPQIKAHALIYNRGNDWRGAQNEAIRELNRAGLSWATLGDTFGVTRQAMQQRAAES